MQETKHVKTKCRCCGHQFPIGRCCPVCKFPVYVFFGQDESGLNEKAEAYFIEHKNTIVTAVGVVFHEPARWDGDRLIPGNKSCYELANLEQLSEEFRWDISPEFASFGRGEEAQLQIYLEHADGTDDVRLVPIKLPPVRGVTWRAAVRLNEARDGVEFAVGTPERFTKTELVKFCDS